ncbi:MAG: hypothetical protein KVP17_001583 [Porospora cf. gigantea B]|uniref:uncharacterized protein n=1 Tax=Porospora cf. gigantea B TaxID=2853592 RepID=UPI003571EF85|nr:MAG: hypothetical protein KVP17_001583 [Porospora cf. gigantea B]
MCCAGLSTLRDTEYVMLTGIMQAVADVCDFLIAVPLLILVVCATWVEERHKQYASVGRGATFTFNFGIWLLNISTVGAVMLQEKRWAGVLTLTRHSTVSTVQILICGVSLISVTAAIAMGGMRVYKRRAAAIKDGGFSSFSSLPWSFMLLTLGNIENFRNNINRKCCGGSSVTFPLIWVVTLKFAVPGLLAVYLVESLNKYSYALQLASANPDNRNLVLCMVLAVVSMSCCQMFLAVPFRPLVEWLTYDGRRWERHAFGDHMTVSLRSIGRVD